MKVTAMVTTGMEIKKRTQALSKLMSLMRKRKRSS
jgi:hypothetical protein